MNDQTKKFPPYHNILSTYFWYTLGLNFILIIALMIGISGLSNIANASPFDDYWDGEQETAPMIDAYQGLNARSKEAFDELYDELDEEKQTPKVKLKKKLSRSKLTQPQRTQEPIKKMKRPTLNQKSHKTSRPNPSGFEAEVLSLVNKERALGGQCGSRHFAPSPPLSAQPLLARAAKNHAIDMAEKRYFSHSSLNGDSPTDRIKATGYKGQAWGENIAAGQRSPKEVVKEWMVSPGHCANILNPLFSELGVSFIFDAQSNYKTYWVQAFGKSI